MLVVLFIIGIISAAESVSVSNLHNACKHAVFGLVESGLPRIEIV